MARDMKNSVISCKNMHGSSLNVVSGAGGPHFNQFGLSFCTVPLHFENTGTEEEGGPG